MLAYLRQVPAALRMLIVLSVALGVLYPLVVLGVAQVPGLAHRADGSTVGRDGHVVGSSLIGQRYTDGAGRPLLQYFQTRPSAGGDDPTATGASNLGPESIVDKPGAPSLLTQVCRRSVALGATYGVDGARPYCTSNGVGAVLSVLPGGRTVSINQTCPARPFVASYDGRTVRCATKGVDYAAGTLVPVRGAAPDRPAVPADAVTASGSGLDPHISPAFARLQEGVVARARGVAVARIADVVARCTDGRDLGFLGEPRVNVVQLNLALDRAYPLR